MSNHEIDWEKHRSVNGAIDLQDAFIDMYGPNRLSPRRAMYLLDIQKLCTMQSRQAAATAIATARHCIPD